MNRLQIVPKSDKVIAETINSDASGRIPRRRNREHNYQSTGQDSCEHDDTKNHEQNEDDDDDEEDSSSQTSQIQEKERNDNGTQQHNHKRHLSWTTTTNNVHTINYVDSIMHQNLLDSQTILQDGNYHLPTSISTRDDCKRARYREPQQEYDDEMSSSREESDQSQDRNNGNSNNNADLDDFQSIESNPPNSTDFLSSGASDVCSTDAVAASESSFNPSGSDSSLNGTERSSDIMKNGSSISLNQYCNKNNHDEQQISKQQEWLLWSKGSDRPSESANLSVSSSTRTEVSENVMDLQERANQLAIAPSPVVVLQAPNVHEQMEGLIHDWSLMHIRSLKRSAADVRQARRDMHRVLRRSSSSYT